MAEHFGRSYGLGDSTEIVRGTPRIKAEITDLPPCPICGCKKLFQVEVDVENPLLKGGKGIGHYIGCAACPFASPMLAVAVGH